MSRNHLVVFCCACLVTVMMMDEASSQQMSVKNDYPYKAELKIKPSNGGVKTYQLNKAGQNGDRATIQLGGEKHTITSVIDGEVMDHEPVNLRDITDGNNTTKLSDLRTKVGSAPNGKTIYQAMPDYPYSDSYEAFINSLKQSSWKGSYGNNRTESKMILDGSEGVGYVGRDKAQLSDLQYVPGSTFYIVGQWEHGGQNGELVLKIDPQKPKELQGHYRTQLGRNKFSNWSSGSAKRLE